MTSIATLWDFSLALYRRPEVEQICLALQDQWGANTNLLLWLRWLEVNNITVDEQQLNLAQERIHVWDQDVVRPLRVLRRQLKAQFAPRQDIVEHTRQSVKNAELSAERVEQEWLEQLARDWQRAEHSIKQGTNLIPYFIKLHIPQNIRSESLAIFSSATNN